MCCDAGVVLASDSKGTESSTGNVLTDQSFVVKKLFPIGTHIAWGAAGSGGVSTRVNTALVADHKGSAGLYNKKAADAEARIRHVIATFMKAEVAALPIPIEVALHTGNFSGNTFLFVGFLDGAPFISELLWDGQLCSYSTQGFHAVGSAGLAAVTTYKMLEHHGPRKSSLEAVRVMLYRIVDTCIRSCSGGVGPPIAMFEITAVGCKELSTEELKATADTVGLWEDQERAALSGLFGGAGVVAAP